MMGKWFYTKALYSRILRIVAGSGLVDVKDPFPWFFLVVCVMETFSLTHRTKFSPSLPIYWFMLCLKDCFLVIHLMVFKVYKVIEE